VSPSIQNRHEKEPFRDTERVANHASLAGVGQVPLNTPSQLATIPDMNTISTHTALIYVMVVVSGADGAMNERELETVRDLIRRLPVFKAFDPDRLSATVADCSAILQEPEGLSAVLGLVAEGLSEPLRETAYWIALETALSDRSVALEEIRVIETMRRALAIDKLVAAALERGARARYQVS
jgi:tellurite resistance protein